MNTNSWIPLSSIYVRQGINIAGHQNRIYDSGPTWVLHLHPQATVISIRYVPEGSTHLIPTSQVECMQVEDAGEFEPNASSFKSLHSQQTGRSSDTSGLVANQVRHQVSEAPVYAVSGAEVLDPEPIAAPKLKSEPSQTIPSSPAQNPANQQQIQAKSEHLAPEEPAPVKKKRGRPRKVAPQVMPSGASF